MSSIQEALDTPKELRSAVQTQMAYVVKQWSIAHRCLACGRQHPATICAPEGWMLTSNFPRDLTCPYSKRRVQIVVPLFGDLLLVSAGEGEAL